MTELILIILNLVILCFLYRRLLIVEQEILLLFGHINQLIGPVQRLAEEGVKAHVITSSEYDYAPYRGTEH